MNTVFIVYIFDDYYKDCGTFTKEAFGKMETCGFYVEGIGLAVVGSFAILANIFTLHVFLRYENM